LKQAAEFMDVPDLYRFLAQEISKTSDYNPDIIAIDIASDNEQDAKRSQRQIQLRGLSEACLLDCLFSDIVFRLDDGTASAHKSLLMARCDMMRAMFSHNDFKVNYSKFELNTYNHI
jgi:Rho-related BTB domain-containing protein 1/2